MALLGRVFSAEEPKVRAAAIRTMGHWAGRIEGWEDLLIKAAKDQSALVRAESVKASVDLGGMAGAEAVFAASAGTPDPEMETVLKYAKSQLKIESIIKQMLASGAELSPAARTYVLSTGTAKELSRLAPSDDVSRAILSRKDASDEQLNAALDRLASSSGKQKTKLLVDLISEEQSNPNGNVVKLGSLFASQPVQNLKSIQGEVENLAINGATPDVKRLGYAAWVAAAGPGDAFLAATKSKERLKDFLDAVPTVDESARGSLFEKVMPLISELPAGMEAETVAVTDQNGVLAFYGEPNSNTAKSEVLDGRTPSDQSVVPKFQMMIPPGKPRDKFYNILKSSLQVSKNGNYTFYIASDDGSMLYIDDKLVINHDGDHGMNEKNAKIKLTAGMHSIRVNYYDSGGGDGLRVSWKVPKGKKEEIPSDRLFVGGEETLHAVAIRALASISGHESEKFNALTSLVAAGREQGPSIAALSNIESGNWTKSEIRPLANNIVGYLSSMPASRRTSESAISAIKFAGALADKLPAKARDSIKDRLSNLDVRVIAIGTVPHRMIYDKEMIVVEAGKPVEFRFTNTDSMPHNFAVAIPGSLQEVGELGESTGRDADAAARGYVPKSDKVLVGSKLLQPGEEEAISFEVPTAPGIYPYVCTYPGHWRRMYGALYVVPSFDEYRGDPEGCLAKLNLPIKDELLARNTRGQEWKYDDLIGDLKMLMGRSHEVGKASFKAANCIACHKFGGEGQAFGPDLAAMSDEKRTTAHILRSLLEPSKDIDDKFASSTFLMMDGRTITGMVMEEDDNDVKIIVDPLAKDKLTVLPLDEIEDRTKSKISQMPAGMVDKLSREEIIDLIAYVISKGDMKHKVFEGGHGH
jgi:putative heme-binding domain-containing protein